MKILAEGKEEDGIEYCITLEGDQWVAIVTHPNGRRLAEHWRCHMTPRCGADVSDVSKGNATLQRLIDDLRGTGIHV